MRAILFKKYLTKCDFILHANSKSSARKEILMKKMTKANILSFEEN